ncbi:MAG: UDP-2,4-diacetamido-2,4,6-trideoxy-beta-L-altropyranose hydrolase [Cytophagales bacterium]|nr:UDP-2,4-diacetamido-2,4,6-trideoxy-beta-L-altropyranose hydrolase [Cytophagales bacterium]
MLNEEFDCVFLIQKPTHYLISQINEVCSKVYELPKSSNYLTEAGDIADKYLQGNEIVVLDGYDFDTAYQKAIKQKGNKLVCIDDIHTNHFVADLVINHSGGIKAEEYSIEPYTKLCLGTEYALLRKPFLEEAKKKRKIDEIKNVFICFGGSDNYNITGKAVEACLGISKIKRINVVIGSINKNREELDALLKNNKNTDRVYLYSSLTAKQMAELMKRCQLGISSASSIAYEICSVGMGLICGAYVDNQKNINDFLSKSKCSISIENFKDITTDELRDIIMDCEIDVLNSQVIFQKSIFRNTTNNLKKVFYKLFNEFNLKIRKACNKDLITYFNWANDTEVRKNAINSATISLNDHTKWFESKLKTLTSYLYICEQEATPIGQVRFDFVKWKYVIDYSLDKEYRGKSLGEVIIKMTIAKLCEENEIVSQLYAEVKEGNIASSKAFLNNSFTLTGKKQIKNISYNVYRKSRKNA